MASEMLKRYGLQGIAKVLIAIGLLFVLFSWIACIYYFGITGNIPLFIPPLIFTCVMAILLLLIKYRYTLFEKYPYLINLPSFFYRIKERKGSNNHSIAFSMIFTVHGLVIAFMGILSLVLTISIGSGMRSNIHGSASPFFLYIYLTLIAILIISVLLQYRRIYIKLAK